MGRLRSTRRVELWDDNLVMQSALAALAAVLAFGDGLIDLELPNEADSQWLSQGGRDSAAAQLLPCAEVVRQELQRLADAVKRAREGQSSSSSGLRAMTARYDGPRACRRPNRAIALNSVAVDPSYVACQRTSSPQHSSRTNSSVVQDR